MTHSWKEGRDPSAGFSVSGYLRQNPDARAAEIKTRCCTSLNMSLLKAVPAGKRITRAGPTAYVVRAGAEAPAARPPFQRRSVSGPFKARVSSGQDQQLSRRPSRRPCLR